MPGVASARCGSRREAGGERSLAASAAARWRRCCGALWPRTLTSGFRPRPIWQRSWRCPARSPFRSAPLSGGCAPCPWRRCSKNGRSASRFRRRRHWSYMSNGTPMRDRGNDPTEKGTGQAAHRPARHDAEQPSGHYEDFSQANHGKSRVERNLDSSNTDVVLPWPGLEGVQLVFLPVTRLQPDRPAREPERNRDLNPPSQT